MAKRILREAAKRDLTIHFAYLGEHASLEVADRFLAAAEHAFQRLAEMLRIGAPRKIRVRIERVIHSARDYRRAPR